MTDELTLLVVIGDSVAPAGDLASKATIPASVRGENFLGFVSGFDGDPPYTYSVEDGSLPDGMSLDADTGVISGTPTNQGYVEFMIRTTDSNGAEFDQVLGIETGGGFSWVTPPQIPVAEHGIAYDTTFQVSGGASPYVFSIQAGSPSGSLTLSGAGAGDYTRASPNAPTATQVNRFRLRATDANGNYIDRDFAEFTLPPIAILVSAYPDGLIGLPYSAARGYVYGLVQPYPAIEPAVQWSITSGALPDGLSLDPLTGTISGSPTTAGFSTWEITVTDAIGGSDSMSTSIYVHSTSDLDKVAVLTFGDGILNSFTLQHDLQLVGILPRSVFVYDISVGPPHPCVEVEWSAVDGNNIQVDTATYPSINQYMAVIVG